MRKTRIEYLADAQAVFNRCIWKQRVFSLHSLRLYPHWRLGRLPLSVCRRPEFLECQYASAKYTADDAKRFKGEYAAKSRGEISDALLISGPAVKAGRVLLLLHRDVYLAPASDSSCTKCTDRHESQTCWFRHLCWIVVRNIPNNV
jgi:hypothetical protein